MRRLIAWIAYRRRYGALVAEHMNRQGAAQLSPPVERELREQARRAVPGVVPLRKGVSGRSDPGAARAVSR